MLMCPPRLLTVAGLTLTSLVFAPMRQAPQGQPAVADLVLTNGKIITVDATDSVAQAIAIAAGRIVAVGPNDEIRSRIGPSTRVIDLFGRTATPGLKIGRARLNSSHSQISYT